MPIICHNDSGFGPGAECRSLDFTVYFQASILSIAPDAIFLFFGSLRLFYLSNQSRKLATSSNFLSYLKLLGALLLMTSSATTLVTYVGQIHGTGLPSLLLPASIISFLSTAFLSLLVFAEHFRSFAPGTMIICYAFCKGIFGATLLRTYHETGISTAAPAAFASLAVATSSYFLVLLFEIIEKRRLLNPEDKDKIIGEASASFVSRSIFLWLFPLMWKGRTTKLTLDDLDEVPEDNRARQARAPLLAALENTKPSSARLLRATFRAFGLPFFVPIIPRLVLLLGTFAQPLLVNKMLQYIQHPLESEQRGWALVGGFVCVYSIISFSTAVFWQKVYAITVRYRAALVGAIYLKTLKLAAHASRSVGSGAASTYMSVDVERIAEGVEILHEFWAALVSIPLAVALLYAQASWAAFAPIGVILIILAVTSWFSKFIGKKQAEWLAVTDCRIKLLSSALSQFLPIKMSAYEPILAKKITELRELEMQKAYGFYQVIMWTASLSNAAATFCSLATLCVYARIATGKNAGYDLDVTKIFTILTTVNLLNGPLNMLGQGLPSLIAAFASLTRIQTFLEMDEKDEPAVTLAISAMQEKTPSSSLEKFEKLDIKNASFSWTKSSPEKGEKVEGTKGGVPVLHDITISLSPGKLHMLVGPVASGKSTLLCSMLGETILLNGTTDAPAIRVAYASQDAFIVVGTCRENILFGRPFVQEWYDRVIEACALPADFARLPFGDQTKLGDRGNSVSGGQKQRLALARAVYADAPLLLLDDVLSALDGETEKHVFAALFGPSGLLAHKTIVLATHNTHHLPSAKMVIVLEHGKVLHFGTSEEVSRNGYDLSGVVQNIEQASESSTDSLQRTTVQKNDVEPSQDDTEDDEAAKSYNSGGWAPYKFFISAVGISRVTIAVLLVTLYSALRLGLQGYIKEWSESNGGHLNSWLGGYIGFSFASFFSGLITFWQYALSITMFSGLNIHHAELTAVFAAPASFFLTTPMGRILNRFSQDIFVIDFTFPIAMLNGLSTSTSIIGNLILIYIATPYLAISSIPMAIGYWFLIKFYLATSKQLQQLEAASKSPLYTVFGNTLSGLETVRAFKAQEHFQAQNDTALNRSQGPFYFRFGGMRFLRTTLSVVTLLIAVGIAALAVGLRKSTSAGLLGIALSNLTSLSQQLSYFLMSYSEIENGTVSIRRIHEMATLEPERDEGALTMVAPTKKGLWPTKGSIVFENFSMKYKSELDPALKNLSFKIGGGQKVGICGRTGSGKSSTVTALFRTLDQSLVSGKILLDGVDISTVPLNLLRNSLSLVSQEPFLWHASLRDIMDPEVAESDRTIWEALGRVGMREAVSALPEKLETVIEDGGSLSRGQKQLLCMARVLLRRSKIVILDEATSSMDLATDEKIRQVVQKDLVDQTVLAVAHRIATIIDFDLILVLDDGRVAEYGSPQELLSNPNSRFSRLAATQGLGAPDMNIEMTTDVTEIQ